MSQNWIRAHDSLVQEFTTWATNDAKKDFILKHGLHDGLVLEMFLAIYDLELFILNVLLRNIQNKMRLSGWGAWN